DGVVSREDLDKAIGHGLAHAPVKGIMSSRVATADEDTPLPELQRLLAGAREGRVAVTSDERVVGVVARSDVLRALGAATGEGARIREDLFRRDFTINAMAVSLRGADYGRLVDPFGGRRDLASETIRVLHNLSFIDDPTRIFRGIRYESRYGFRMDEHTLRLAHGCIEMGLVGDLSSARLREELDAILSEEEVRHTILRLAELGADKAIHPHLAADEEAADLIERMRALRAEYGVDVGD